jgi:predicted transposase/invertase (TIGR01784 family)
MRRDSIFYQLFRQSPTLLFELLPQPPDDAESYIFEAIEVKETGFRMDGVFLPPNSSGIVYFCEVQFQFDDLLYERMNSEIGIYIYRNRERFFGWQAVVIYPTRTVEQSRTETVRDLLASRRIIPVYLDELGEIEQLPIGLGLMVLTTLEGDEAITEARRSIARSRSFGSAESQGSKDIIKLISTIIVYKFSNLSRDEVDAMLGIELQQTRVYQEARQEGKAEGEIIGEARGEARMIMKLLNRRLGGIPDRSSVQIQQLSVPQLEDLGEALLDFTSLADLEGWLSQLTVDR